MSRAGFLTRSEFELIRRHNELLAEGMRATITNIRAIKSIDRPEYLQGTLWYFLDCVAALDWSTRVAAQRAGVSHVIGQ